MGCVFVSNYNLLFVNIGLECFCQIINLIDHHVICMRNYKMQIFRIYATSMRRKLDFINRRHRQKCCIFCVSTKYLFTNKMHSVDLYFICYIYGSTSLRLSVTMYFAPSSSAFRNTCLKHGIITE